MSSSSRHPARAALVALAFALVPLLAWAQDAPVPERFATTRSDTDLPGGDLGPIFDVTLTQCHAACLRDEACAGFTFDRRNGACFPKGVVGPPAPFVGAISGVITAQAPDALERAREVAATLDFLDATDLAAAREQAATMAERHPAEGRDETFWLEAARGQAPADAVAATGAAVTVEDGGAAWLAHARALANAAAQDDDRRYALNRQAASAAINAALRLDGPRRAEALLILARALEATYRGEAALGAVRLADRLVPGIAGDTLVRLREAFGFRVLAHDVDASSAAPRICATFSEPLSPGRDYGPFVQRSVAGLALEVDGPQLCVSGVVYGGRYVLTFRAGLPSATGDTLVRDVPLEVYVRDRAPSVRFPGRAYVLPARGPRAIPVETVNANELELRLLRVSDRNLVAAIREQGFAQALSVWEGERFEDELAEVVWQGDASLDGALNRATTSLLPLDEVGPLAPGVYLLRASVPGIDPYDVAPASQWFLISDLGVTTLAGSDGLHVVVQRLSDGRPAEGLRVDLVARSNRVLGDATTDAEGHARFAAALARGTGNAAPALLLVEGDGDLAVLSLEEPAFDLSDRGVEGRAAPGPIDVFLTTDRGAYRPGETIHVTALTRDAAAGAIPGLPITARLLRPDGLEYARVVSGGGLAGGHVVAFPLGGGVPRGVWRVEILTDPDAPPLVSEPVLVEDFLPERVDVQLTLDRSGPVDLSDPPRLRADARYLFGAPASGLALTGSVTVAASDRLDGWPGFRFGRHDQRGEPERRWFEEGLTTDADGTVTAPLPLEDLELDARPYDLTATATLLDGASRPVERQLTRPIRPTGPVVGIRPGFDGALPEQATATFDLVLANPDGSVRAGELRWQVDRVLTRYQWYAIDGRWFWEPVTERQRVAEGVATVADGPVAIQAPVTWGPYELRVSHEGATLASASLPFEAGWYGVGGSRDTPDLLRVSLDAERYAPGEVARLRIEPEGAGTALVAVLAERVVDLRLVPVDGATTVELPVTEAWGSGVYVAASLVRPSDGAGYAPARSLGVVHAEVAPGDRALAVTLIAPDEADPRGRLELVLDAPGARDGEAYATVAAVDLGVLTLTGFTSPDPQGHYFGQRRLGVAIRDLYGRLIDANQGEPGRVRSGGGLESEEMEAGPAPAQELLALFSGPVTLTGGRAEVDFELPAFDGTVRLMAVVWSDDAVGQAEADVLVRDPVVVQPSLPRFLTPGDASRLRVELTHVTGPSGAMELAVEGHGVAAGPTPIELDEGGRAVVDVPLRPVEVGEHLYRVDLTLPDGRVLTRELRLTVQHGDPETARTSRFELAPGATVRLDDEALAGYRPGTVRASLVAGAGAALDVPGLTLRLSGYPYGCTEQLASGLVPLLWAPDAVAEMGLGGGTDARDRVQRGIDGILARQQRTGGFGLWGAQGSSDAWLDAYVTDVLLRAEAQGFDVPAMALRMALDRLRTQAAQAGSLRSGASATAYAFYVLAQAGEAAIGDLRYYADTLAERFDTPLAAAQLGAALAVYGERERAEAMFAQAARLARTSEAQAGWRADYGTALRDRAGLLALAAEAGSGGVDRMQLASQVGRSGPAHQLSTQEAAWSLRAAAALGAEADGLVVDGRPVSGDVVLAFDGTPVTLRNDGDAPVTVTLTAFGVPEVPPPAGGVGYGITRRHYTPDGEETDLSDVRVGDRIVVVLEVRPDRGVPGGRLMVDDALAAGFEIDNANLLRQGDVRALDWLGVHADARATEARADRFLAAVDWTEGAPLRLAYVMRAVSPGAFHYPAAAVEDMYRPGNRAVSATGRVTIGP